MDSIGNIQIDTCYSTTALLEVEHHQDCPSRCNSHALLDSEGCISLGNILATYDAPINEEHAWALCYLSGKCLESHLLSSNNNNSTPSLENILLFKQTPNCSSDLIKICHQKGHVVLNVEKITVKKDTAILTELEKDKRKEKLLTRSKLVSKIAMAVYKALDFGMREDEERSLSFQLEDMLVQMTASAEDNNNNNILCEEHYCFLNPNQLNEQDIFNFCLDHFESTGLAQCKSADVYYQQICKNLVLDTLEFWKFLRVAEQASQKLKYLCGISDHLPARHNKLPENSATDVRESLRVVAKNWIQVVRELKQGVTLKQRDDSDHLGDHHEYSKSPYELLMEDIRSKKYRLREVGESEAKDRKTALNLHDIVMRHIRSCPKLQNAAERVLKPVGVLQKTDPREELMRSIRQVHRLRAVASAGSV